MCLNGFLYFFLLFSGTTAQREPGPPHSLRFVDHTQWHTTVGRTPLDEGSAHRRNLYLTTHSTHNRRAPSGITNPNPSKRSVVDTRLRPPGLWNRQCFFQVLYNSLVANYSRNVIWRDVVYIPYTSRPIYEYMIMRLCKVVKLAVPLSSFFNSNLRSWEKEIYPDILNWMTASIWHTLIYCRSFSRTF